MDDGHDELFERLARLDPIAVDQPPARGSTRFNKIEDKAMELTKNSNTPSSEALTTGVQPFENDPATRPMQRPTPRRGRVMLAVAAVAAAVLAFGLTNLPGSGTRSAEAAILAAAQGLGDATSLRVTFTSEDPEVPAAVGEVDGDRFHISFDDGVEVTYIEGTEWVVENGVLLDPAATPPGDVPASPFPEVSEAFVTAALQGGEISELGEREIDGVTVTGYRIELDSKALAAIGEIGKADLLWFDLAADGPTSDAISIWVADDLIHQIDLEGDENRTITYYDFGGDIEVVPPTE